MIKLTLQVVVLLFLISCSNKKIEPSSLVGSWEVDSINIGYIHAVYEVPKSNSFGIDQDFINPGFKLEIKNNLNFLIQNQDGSKDYGFCVVTSDSLIFRKEKDEDWLRFKIEEVPNEVLKLKADKIIFYSLEKDSILFFTGDEVKIILKSIR
ncbi:MAG: hypothetical protein LPK19_03500 [Hymenobacteraceae bacterium]|nr:hypothetical protein [Hymenobacteraceae bacterium]MDX5395257.1 hypothetical protein [Hymenobacteraceae bacterium]MDX5511295.1 hypothetical protein [Hymenobacteraceae bacterium]